MLALKDELGNALAITGIALFGDGDYVRYEVDNRGRPALYATSKLEVYFSRYTENSVDVDVWADGDEPYFETVALSAAEHETRNRYAIPIYLA